MTMTIYLGPKGHDFLRKVSEDFDLIANESWGIEKGIAAMDYECSLIPKNTPEGYPTFDSKVPQFQCSYPLPRALLTPTGRNPQNISIVNADRRELAPYHQQILDILADLYINKVLRAR